MGEQSGARLGGDDYQHLYSWYEMLQLLREDSPYEYAYIEHPKAGAADDLTLHPKTNVGVPASFYQVKWHVDYREQYTFEKLIEIATDSSRSLLHKLYDSWKDLRGDGEIEVWLVSNWSPAPHPNLGAYLSGRTPQLSDDFYSQKKRSRVAQWREAWAASLQISHNEVIDFCRALRFRLGYMSVDRLTEQVDDRMARYGLRHGANARAVVLDELRTRIQQGGEAKRITRSDLISIIARRELRADLPDAPAVRLWIHGWAEQGFDVEPTVELDWTCFYDRDERRVPTAQEWREDLLPQLNAARKEFAAAPNGKYIDFRGKLSLTACLAVGAMFPHVGGFSFRAEQPTGGELFLWSSVAAPSDARFHIVEQEGQNGEDLAVGLSVSGTGLSDLRRFLGGVGISNYVYAEPVGGAGHHAVRDASDAVALANSAKELIQSARAHYEAKRIHLFLYCPATFALFLGQVLNALGIVVTYERTVDGGYQESVTLKTG
jgi:hypothetical protein